MELRKTTRIQKTVYATITGLVIVMFCGLAFLAGSFERLEQILYDVRFRVRGEEVPNPSVLLVTINEYDKDQFRRNIKDWSREVYAVAVDVLTEAGAAVIAFDLDFSMPTTREADERFADSIARSGRVVLGRSLNRAPYELFRNGALGEGTFDLQFDSDGTVRSVQLIALGFDEEGQQTLQPPLGLELAQLYLFPVESPTVSIEGESLYLDNLRVPGHMLINYCGPPGTYPSCRFSDLIAGRFQPESVKGKFVLIGNTDPLAHDYFSTPFPAIPGRSTDSLMTVDIQRMSGLEIHANIFDTLISNKGIIRLSPLSIFLLILGCGIVVTLITSLISGRPSHVALAILMFIALILGLSVLLFVRAGVWLDTVPLLSETILIFVAVTFMIWRIDIREKNQIRSLFGKYVSPQIAELLVEEPGLISFRGKKAMLTMFFSDIRGFTSMSEDMDPQDVSNILNNYFARMTKILFAHDGTLDKFMGDAIMAFFGNPQYYEDHAFRAVHMSLDMIEEVKRMNIDLQKRGLKAINIGIGINTGIVTVGNLGSEDYFDYTVIGDDVNLACRLESIAGPGQIIISDKTWEQVKDRVQVNKLDPVKVKGKEKPVQIYEVIDLLPSERNKLNNGEAFPGKTP